MARQLRYRRVQRALDALTPLGGRGDALRNVELELAALGLTGPPRAAPLSTGLDAAALAALPTMTFKAGKMTSMKARRNAERFQATYEAADARKDEFAFIDFGINSRRCGRGD